ncbi:MAG TPA: hypothetical protein VKB03_10320 [Conexibacter sp.]|nr:hypothetical protein [Conexibacter sp.]
MAQRSRKRGRREPPRDAFGDPTSSEPVEAAVEPRRRRSSAERNAELRARLEPLAEGERPGAVTVGAIVAAVLAVLMVVGYLSGARIGDGGSLPGVLTLAAILLLAAWGMWHAKYWAVLGFEALLAFQVLVAALSLLVASNVWAAFLCLAVIGLGGWLFWKLIRAMARIQMPERRPAP